MFKDISEELIGIFAEILRCVKDTYDLYNKTDYLVKEILAQVLRITIKINDEEYEAETNNLKYEVDDTLNWHDQTLNIIKAKNKTYIPYFFLDKDKEKDVYDQKEKPLIQLINYYIAILEGKELPMVDFNKIKESIPNFQRPILLLPEASLLKDSPPSYKESIIWIFISVLAESTLNIPLKTLELWYNHDEYIIALTSIVRIYSIEDSVMIKSILTSENKSLSSFKEFMNTFDIPKKIIEFETEKLPEHNISAFTIASGIDLKVTDKGYSICGYGPLDAHIPKCEGLIIYWVSKFIDKLQEFLEWNVYFGEFTSRTLYFDITGELIFIPEENSFKFTTTNKGGERLLNEFYYNSVLGYPPELINSNSINNEEQDISFEKIMVYHLGLLLGQLYMGLTKTEFYDELINFAGNHIEAVNKIIDTIQKKKISKNTKEITNLIRSCLSQYSYRRPNLINIKQKLRSITI